MIELKGIYRLSIRIEIIINSNYNGTCWSGLIQEVKL